MKTTLSSNQDQDCLEGQHTTLLVVDQARDCGLDDGGYDPGQDGHQWQSFKLSG